MARFSSSSPNQLAFLLPLLYCCRCSFLFSLNLVISACAALDIPSLPLGSYFYTTSRSNVTFTLKLSSVPSSIALLPDMVMLMSAPRFSIIFVETMGPNKFTFQGKVSMLCKIRCFAPNKMETKRLRCPGDERWQPRYHDLKKGSRLSVTQFCLGLILLKNYILLVIFTI